MKQAITTKYLPYTNTKPSRVKATTSSGISLTMSYDHELSADGNHTAVAKALVEKLGWQGVWVAGGLPNGNCYVGLPRGFSEDGLGELDLDWFAE
jgi:hypothetical protein